ncbi:PREDICTED: 1-acyl-sn-glycerol-3-phosphate acyltransferase delta-like isoform X2 [Polistes dominula]|nr:PREDICTED: 1-acyl-sn-glycerol-3-phosphate acyltransferase delta-like isoform X2 [Polistes dominula]
MAEWWSGSDIIFYIDKKDYEKYYGRENVYILMNHSYEIDWLIGWVACSRFGVLGNCKAYAKKSILYIPALGWAWKFAESIFLERNWNKDKNVIGKQIKELLDYPDPIWLLLYAEGTRVTPKKIEACQKFAKEKNLPILKYHLTPRTKGFICSIPNMRGKSIAIYNIQVAFKESDPVKPTMTNLLLGKKVEAHMYMKRIPLSEVPEDDDAAADWLHKLYQEKDYMMESFHKTGDFFATSGVAKPDTFILNRSYASLFNTIFWFVVVLVPMIYYLIKLFLSGSTLYFSIGVGILLIFYLLMDKTIQMSEISNSSSYGAADAKKIE